MKVGLIGDAHLGSTDYSTKRRADFSAAFCAALETCVREGAEVICLLGDVFDSAVTRRNVDTFADVLQEIAPALAALKKRKVPLVAIAGNHEFGRGREAGELRMLETLDFLRVLRGEEVTFGRLGICGVPWQERPERLIELSAELQQSSRAPERILLLHNFVRGSRTIPAELGQVDHAVAKGFDRVFAGHHHVGEELGPFVIPGSTEIQNMLDVSEKTVVVYDSESRTSVFHPLPRTRRVLPLRYDASAHTREELLSRIAQDLESNGPCAGAFVYISVTGNVEPGLTASRAEILALLRSRDVFDRYVEVRVSTRTAVGQAIVQGASIDHLLSRDFSRKEIAKAQDYLEKATRDDLWISIRDRILA